MYSSLNNFVMFSNLVLISIYSQQSLNQGTDWQDAYKVHCAQTVRNLDGGSTLLEYAFCLPTLTLFHCYFDEWGSSSHSSDINHINIRRYIYKIFQNLH